MNNLCFHFQIRVALDQTSRLALYDSKDKKSEIDLMSLSVNNLVNELNGKTLFAFTH